MRLELRSGLGKSTIFQERLENSRIRHKLILPYAPRHNGKVVCNHQKDNERFYATHAFYSQDSFSNQLKVNNCKNYDFFLATP